jgi:hypothetical protein
MCPPGIVFVPSLALQDHYKSLTEFRLGVTVEDPCAIWVRTDVNMLNPD